MKSTRFFKSILILVAAAPSLAGAAEPLAPTVQEGLTYRVVEGREFKLDIAIPVGEGPFPAILFLHGGAWVVGNRDRFRDEIEEAARRDFIGATVTYHLAKTGVDRPSVDGFPAPLEDVKAAIRFLRANAQDFKLDSNHIGIAGESAGGHLALLAALTKPEDGFDQTRDVNAPSSEVQAVVNVFGPTDLLALAEENPQARPVLVMLLGSAPELDPQRYRAASPVSYVRRDAPPILTIHGTRDGLVPVSQARRLDAAMKKAGARHQLMILNGSGHGFGRIHAQQTQRAYYDFFTRTLKP